MNKLVEDKKAILNEDTKDLLFNTAKEYIMINSLENFLGEDTQSGYKCVLINLDNTNEEVSLYYGFDLFFYNSLTDLGLRILSDLMKDKHSYLVMMPFEKILFSLDELKNYTDIIKSFSIKDYIQESIYSVRTYYNYFQSDDLNFYKNFYYDSFKEYQEELLTGLRKNKKFVNKYIIAIKAYFPKLLKFNYGLKFGFICYDKYTGFNKSYLSHVIFGDYTIKEDNDKTATVGRKFNKVFAFDELEKAELARNALLPIINVNDQDKKDVDIYLSILKINEYRYDVIDTVKRNIETVPLI